MIGTSHTNPGAELACHVIHALIVGGDESACQVAGERGSLVHVLKHALAGNFGEDFSWETAGSVPRGNHAQDFTWHRKSYHESRYDKLEQEAGNHDAAVPS